MKKYLAALVPFVVCSLASLLFFLAEPKDYPDPSYPYRTPAYLGYFTNRWFWIGVVLSVIVLFIIGIEDFSNYLKRREQQRFFR